MGSSSKGPAPRTHAPPSDSGLGGADLGLHAAVSRGDVGLICYALLGGQAIDSLRDGLQAIHVAASQPDPAVVEMLLQNGADANARTLATTTAAPEPATPSRKARLRLSRNRSSFSLFRSAGVGPISAPSGFSAGTRAAVATTPPPTPSDPFREYHGATPLHFAVAGAHVACIEALLRGGARADIADSYGNTPESIAAACGSADVAALFACVPQAPARDCPPATAPPTRFAVHQLPSPSPSVRSRPTSPPLPATLPSRRYTAGEVDAYLHYGNGGRPPAGTWTKATHRDASPIGIRALSIAHARRHPVPLPLQPIRPATTGSHLRGVRSMRPPLRAAMPGCSGGDAGGTRGVSRNSSSASSRRERSNTDSVIERAWRSYLYHGDEQARESAHRIATGDAAGDPLCPLPEPWMWQQAAVAVRSRRTQSLSAASRTPGAGRGGSSNTPR